MVLVLLVGGNLAQAQDIQMLPPVRQDNGVGCWNGTDSSQINGHPRLLGWDGFNPINCITTLTLNPSVSGANAWLGVASDIRIPYSNAIIFGDTGTDSDGGAGEQIHQLSPDGTQGFGLGFRVGWQDRLTINQYGYVGIGNPPPATALGNLDIENSSNNATLCLNGNCTHTAFNPATCHIVSNMGGPPDYVSDARCANNEFALNGGGQAEITGSPNCSSGNGTNTKGTLHTSFPDSDGKGWTVDAFDWVDNHEACTIAYATCCAM